MSAAAIDVEGLTHRYPAVNGRQGRADPGTALKDVHFQVAPGSAFGVLGPNGSGKSTLFRILATLLKPTAGTARIGGHDVGREAVAVRRQCGVMFQSPSVDLQLTAWENVWQQGRMYGLDRRVLRERVGGLLDEVGLADRRNERLLHFSGGMRRRVELAKALVHRPRLLLLDEPSTGLDLAARRAMWETLATLRYGHGITVAMTTHLMDDAARCATLMILDAGRCVTVEAPKQLMSSMPRRIVQLTPTDPSDAAALRDVVEATFGPWHDTPPPSLVDGDIRFEHADGAAVAAQIARDQAGRIRALHVADPGLEDVFLRLTGNRFEVGATGA